MTVHRVKRGLDLPLANVAVLRPRRPLPSDLLSGVLLGMVVLTKVNVGAMLLLPLAYVAVAEAPGAAGRRWRRGVGVGALLLGPALFAFQLPAIRDLPPPTPLTAFNRPITLVYWGVLYVVSAAVTLWFAGAWSSANPTISGLASDRRPGPVLSRMLLGAASASALIVGAVLLRGTSPRRLGEGVLIRPGGQARALTILMGHTGLMWFWIPGAFVLVLASRWLVGRDDRTARSVSAAVRLLAAGLLLTKLPWVTTQVPRAGALHPSTQGHCSRGTSAVF